MNWYTHSAREVLAHLSADKSRGLTGSEARARLGQYGPNQLEGKRGKSLPRKFAEQFSDFMVLILVAAAILSLLISILEGNADFLDPIIILAIVILNATMGVVQEAKAERAIESLQKLSAPKSRVVRDGVQVTIDSVDVVPGDILLYETGDAITADARIISCSGLRIEESSLTGESNPVTKDADALVSDDAPVGERKTMVYSGSVVVAGRCTAVAAETGMNTEVGKIAQLLGSAETPDTPLQRRLADTGKTLGLAALLICAFIFLLGVIQHTSLLDSFMLAVSLAVAAVPEGLPAIVTIVLALGVQRMARKNAIVRKLPAVETLGSATVICSDKTGTLTQNKMTVQDMAGAGEGQLDAAGRRKLLLYGALCANTTVKKVDGVERAEGDPTEAAIVNAALAQAINVSAQQTAYPRLGEVPFDSTRKRMSTLRRGPEGSLLIVKGAPDVLLGLCSAYEHRGEAKPLTEQRKRDILLVNNRMADRALRVIAVAYKPAELSATRLNEAAESDLIFLGLIAMQDPPRPEVRDAVRVCKRAGIRPVMITGDHAATAAAIARELGMLSGQGQVLTGAELDQLSDVQLRQEVKCCTVFARVSPEHKSRVVRAFQANGEIVAMTGDGVNDAPALKHADIGCAMGKSGTDVARDAADMILTDDNFATIVAAVQEGRGIYQNIVKSVHFLLSCNVGEILTILFAFIMGMPSPLLPIQLLWVNLVTDSLPALALGVEKPERDIMDRPPVDPKSSIFAGGLGGDILVQGLMIGGISLLAFFTGVRYGDYTTGRTFAFAVLSLSQLVHAFNVRSRESLFKIGFLSNTKMVMAFLVCCAMQVSVICIAPLAAVFGVVPLTVGQWRIVVGIALIPLVAVELGKLVAGGRSEKKAEAF